MKANPTESIPPRKENDDSSFSSNDLYEIPNMDHASKGAVTKLLCASIVCFILMIIEAFGGIFAHSLAILTDAAHMFSDLSGFFISIFSLWLAKKPPTNKLSYGFHRAEVIGAMLSIFIIWLVTCWLVVEAIDRIIDPDYEINEYLMLATAIFGLLCNLLIAKILHSGGYHDHFHNHGHNHSLEHNHEHNKNHCENENHHHHDNNDQCDDHDHNKQEHHHHEEEIENHYESKETKNQKIEKIFGSHDDEESHNNETKYNELNEEQDEKNLEKNINATNDNNKKKNKNLSMISENDNVNLRAAMMHILGDIAQSIGVIIAALIIFFNKEYKVADPICTFIFAFLVLATTYHIMKDCVAVIMEGVPDGFHLHEFEDELKLIDGVLEIHDLHIWALTVGKPALSAHIISNNPEKTLKKSTKLCRTYGIYHTTIQIENSEKMNDNIPLICKQNIHSTIRIDLVE